MLVFVSSIFRLAKCYMECDISIFSAIASTHLDFHHILNFINIVVWKPHLPDDIIWPIFITTTRYVIFSLHMYMYTLTLHSWLLRCMDFFPFFYFHLLLFSLITPSRRLFSSCIVAPRFLWVWHCVHHGLILSNSNWSPCSLIFCHWSMWFLSSSPISQIDSDHK